MLPFVLRANLVTVLLFLLCSGDSVISSCYERRWTYLALYLISWISVSHKSPICLINILNCQCHLRSTGYWIVLQWEASLYETGLRILGQALESIHETREKGNVLPNWNKMNFFLGNYFKIMLFIPVCSFPGMDCFPRRFLDPFQSTVWPFQYKYRHVQILDKPTQLRV